MESIPFMLRRVFCKRNLVFFILFLFFFQFVFSFNVLSEDLDGSYNVNTYVIDQYQGCMAHEGSAGNGIFYGNEKMFSNYDYSVVSDNDENCVEDSSGDYLNFSDNHQYHRFLFLIEEDIENIRKIDINWYGYGGVGYLSISTPDPSSEDYGYSLWVEYGDTGFIKEKSGTNDEIAGLSVQYTSNFTDIIDQDGFINVGVQSDYAISSSISWVTTCYIEVKVTYIDQGSEESSVLSVSNPENVVEGESFDVTVTSDGSPVIDAFVEFDGSNITTDDFGVAGFVAPDFVSSSPYSIFVSKPGYIGSTSSIVVLENNSSSEELVLDVSAPVSVLEGEGFDVTVTSDTVPVMGVSVVCDGSSGVSDVSGGVSLVAPFVVSDSYVDVSASLDGYTDGSAQILVLNDDSSLVDPELSVSAPVSVLEGEGFDVTVTSEGSAVSGASVSFVGESLVTDDSGIVSFTAPMVDTRTDFSVVASKSGFVSDSSTVSVLDSSVTDVVLSYPVGGETLSGVVDVLWSVVNPPAVNLADPVSSAFVGLWYKMLDGSWTEIVDDLSISTTGYSWDAGGLVDGVYFLRVVLDVDGVLYEDVSGSFTVDNNGEIEDGIICGKVTELDASTPVKNVEVCIKLSESPFTYRCAYTDENGNYSLSSIPGSYLVKVNKKSYQVSTKTVEINENEETLVDFVLEKTQVQQENLSDNEELFFNYVIEDASDENSAGAKIDVDETEIKVFTDDLDVSIEKQELNNLELKVSAPSNTSSKIIFIKASSKIFTDVQSINSFNVKYDGSIIERKTIDYLINNIDNASEPSWTIFSSFDKDEEETYYLAVLVPSFSEHSIKLYTSIEQVFGGLVAIIYNILFIIVVGLAVAGITIYRIKH